MYQKKELDALSGTATNCLFYSSFWQQAETSRFCKYMERRRQGARTQFCDLWYISNILLPQLV